jgi:hypothetical protein
MTKILIIVEDLDEVRSEIEAMVPKNKFEEIYSCGDKQTAVALITKASTKFPEAEVLMFCDAGIPGCVGGEWSSMFGPQVAMFAKTRFQERVTVYGIGDIPDQWPIQFGDHIGKDLHEISERIASFLKSSSGNPEFRYS